MAVPPATELVRLLFEARASGDVRRVLSLLHPEVEDEALTAHGVLHGRDEVRAELEAECAPGGVRVELAAHRVVADGERVLVLGRVRTIDHGRLADSPAAWALTVHDGLVATIASLAAEPLARRLA